MAKIKGTNEYGAPNSKKGISSVYPEKVLEGASGLTRVEPFLTPDVLKDRFLWGIPLTSPVTKQKITDSMLKDFIQRAANDFELMCQVEIFQVVRRYRLPFDPNLYFSFMTLEVPNKPIQTVIDLSIRAAAYNSNPDQDTAQYPATNLIYKIPNQWIDMANASRGTLIVNPLNPAFSAIGADVSAPAGGATIMQFIGQSGWVPSYWNTEVVCGFGTAEGQVPVIINEAVGCMATMLVLDNLIPQFRYATQSLGIDGLSQSVNDNMFSLLQEKRKNADEQAQKYIKRIKQITSSKFFSGHV